MAVERIDLLKKGDMSVVPAPSHFPVSSPSTPLSPSEDLTTAIQDAKNEMLARATLLIRTAHAAVDVAMRADAVAAAAVVDARAHSPATHSPADSYVKTQTAAGGDGVRGQISLE